MNKLIKWLTDLYYSQQRRPDEPEVTYQEPIAEPVEKKYPLDDYDTMYDQNNNYYGYYYGCYCLFATTDYKVWKMGTSKQVK